MSTDKKTSIIVRLACIMMAVPGGWLLYMLLSEWLPNHSSDIFDTVSGCIILLFSSAVILYLLYNALFYNKISQNRELKEQQRKRKRLAQIAALREEHLRHPIDTDTLILLDNVTNYDQLEKCILDNMDDNDEESLENLPLLKKRGEGSYAITFPFGVTRQALCQLVDDIWCFCSCTVQAWCRPKLFKKHTGEWLYLCYGKEDILIALDENETQWNINPDDSMLYRTEKHDCFYKARPEITLSTPPQNPSPF